MSTCRIEQPLSSAGGPGCGPGLWSCCFLLIASLRSLGSLGSLREACSLR
jgi:hypothetical protein